MMRPFTILITALLFGLIGQAQDSFAVFRPAFIRHLDSITEIEVLASLEDSSVMVGREKMETFLYVKNIECWTSWSIEAKCETDFLAIGLNIQLESKEVNKEGRPEILIWWETESGISTPNHGWSEGKKGIQLWNIDSRTRLLDLVYEERLENWSLQTEMPFEQAMLEDSVQGEKIYELYDEWFFYHLEINPDSLVISKLQRKGDASQDTEPPNPSPIKEGVFKLREGRFVRNVKE